jgi:putative ATP-binding cassette transporter
MSEAHMASQTASNVRPEGFSEPPRPSVRLKQGFFRQFFQLTGGYWASDEKWLARGLLLGLIALTLGQIFVSIRINHWSADLFNALEEKSMEKFLVQIGVLAAILIANVAVGAAHLRVRRRLQIAWRRWLTRRLLGDWMGEGRHYQVSFMPGEHDNPDGRIAEDIRVTTEAAIELAHSLFYCTLLLVSFVEILWVLSGPLAVAFNGFTLTVPGHMVWVALLYSTAGTVLALILGRPLISAMDKRQTAEANFRFSLVRARENSEAIALVKGETDERRRFKSLFTGVVAAWQRQSVGLMRLFLFTSAYSVLATAFPVLVNSPRYIAGAITLGVLMQTAQAFQQVAAALSWPVDNLSKLAEWRASVERVLSLYGALQDLKEDVAYIDQHTIEVSASEKPGIEFSGLSIANPDGEVLLSGFNAQAEPGDRVLIAGDPAIGVKLFKVVAGLWPWGRGRVNLPCQASIFFMPQRPYLPLGSLRGALTYPQAPDGFETMALREALEQTGLGHLAQRLDETQNWEQTLALGEQQRLGFARLILHKPNWIFIQEATDALDPKGEEEMMRLLETDEFKGATVLTVGYHSSLEKYHRRKLVLARAASGQAMIKESRVKREAERAARQKKGVMPWHARLAGTMRPNQPRRERGGER